MRVFICMRVIAFAYARVYACVFHVCMRLSMLAYLPVCLFLCDRVYTCLCMCACVFVLFWFVRSIEVVGVGACICVQIWFACLCVYQERGECERHNTTLRFVKVRVGFSGVYVSHNKILPHKCVIAFLHEFCDIETNTLLNKQKQTFANANIHHDHAGEIIRVSSVYVCSQSNPNIV